MKIKRTWVGYMTKFLTYILQMLCDGNVSIKFQSSCYKARLE
jgi:hypothetical protein